MQFYDNYRHDSQTSSTNIFNVNFKYLQPKNYRNIDVRLYGVSVSGFEFIAYLILINLHILFLSKFL